MCSKNRKSARASRNTPIGPPSPSSTSTESSWADPTSCAKCISPVSCRNFSPEKKPPLSRRPIALSQFRKEALDHPLGLRRVAAAEQIRVVEHVVQVVQRFSHCVALIEWCGFRVGGVESLRKSAEQLGHGEVRFAVSPVNGRIEKHRRTAGQKARVS